MDLTALTTAVADNSTVEGGVLKLVQELAAHIQNIPASNDPATQAHIDALVKTLVSNDAALAAAVAANTAHAAPVGPLPAPTPEPTPVLPPAA